MVTICGSGQYLGLVERELYSYFTEWNKKREDITNQTKDEETKSFREFLGIVYEIKNGPNLLDILSTMISPDLDATAATMLVKHQQQCGRKSGVLPRRKRATDSEPDESLCPLPDRRPRPTGWSGTQDADGLYSWETCADHCRLDPSCSHWMVGKAGNCRTLTGHGGNFEPTPLGRIQTI